jgi:dTDP-4-amino-4,6-dideoxygalactose transaminase
MDKTLGKEYENLVQREAYLKDNCEKVEEKGYMKPFTLEQLQGCKENLAELSIKIEELEDEKKASARHFKVCLDPLYEKRREMVANVRKKSEYVREVCYKFVDKNEHLAGYYNASGDLIESRPATADELQLTIFPEMKKTGTN